MPNQKDINNNQDNDSENVDNKLNLAPPTVTLDMSTITDYKKIEHDNKTIILYKIDLQITTFDHFKQITQNGLNISWIGIITHRKIIVVGSDYHSK